MNSNCQQMDEFALLKLGAKLRTVRARSARQLHPSSQLPLSGNTSTPLTSAVPWTLPWHPAVPPPAEPDCASVSITLPLLPELPLCFSAESQRKSQSQGCSPTSPRLRCPFHNSSVPSLRSSQKSHVARDLPSWLFLLAWRISSERRQLQTGTYIWAVNALLWSPPRDCWV